MMTVPAFRAAGIARGVARGSWVAASPQAKARFSGPTPVERSGISAAAISRDWLPKEQIAARHAAAEFQPAEVRSSQYIDLMG